MFHSNRQAGDSIMSVLVAMALLSILVYSASKISSYFTALSLISRKQGEFQDLRIVLRSSVACDIATCTALLDDFPEFIGDWEINASCLPSGYPKVMARRDDYRNGNLLPVFKPGTERAVCKTDLPTPDSPGERQYCPPGSVVVDVDFSSQTIQCE